MIQIDRFGRTPIYEQIIEQIQRLIITGVLKAGDQLPSVRTLSQELSINPNTLQKAYSELERRGVCISAPGNGRFVTENAIAVIGESMEEQIEEIIRIGRELYAAGIPIERVLKAIQSAYGKESKV